MLTIGQLAKITDNSTVTIRYYEKYGLIPSSKRSDGGYRLYPESLIPRFRFIKNAKLVGFSLDEIKELLLLQALPHSKGQHIKDITIKKLSAIKEKINSLQKMQRALKHLAASCNGQMPIQECPILEALFTENKKELESYLLTTRKHQTHEQCTHHTSKKRKHCRN